MKNLFTKFVLPFLFLTICLWTNDPKTTIVKEISTVQVYDLKDYPKTTPKDLSELAKFVYRDIIIQNQTTLDWTTIGNKTGVFITPDGGTLRRYNLDTYNLKRKDGLIIANHGNNHFSMSFHGSTIHQKTDESKQITVFLFPDNTELTMHKNLNSNQAEFSYYHRGKDKTEHYRIVQPNTNLMNMANIGNIEFYFKPELNSYIELFRTTKISSTYIENLKKRFHVENKGKIPVLLFMDKNEFMAYEGITNSQITYISTPDHVSVCCNYNWVEPDPTKNPNSVQVDFRKIYYGLTENFLYHSCFYSDTFIDPVYRNASNSFVYSGLAEYVLMDIYPEYKRLSFADYYRLLESDKSFDLYSPDWTKIEDYALINGMMWNHLAMTKEINQILKFPCNAKNPINQLEKIDFGQKLNQSIQYYKANKEEILKEWKLKTR